MTTTRASFSHRCAHRYCTCGTVPARLPGRLLLRLRLRLRLRHPTPSRAGNTIAGNNIASVIPPKTTEIGINGTTTRELTTLAFTGNVQRLAFRLTTDRRTHYHFNNSVKPSQMVADYQADFSRLGRVDAVATR